jgi:hypothetical protein
MIGATLCTLIGLLSCRAIAPPKISSPLPVWGTVAVTGTVMHGPPGCWRTNAATAPFLPNKLRDVVGFIIHGIMLSCRHYSWQRSHAIHPPVHEPAWIWAKRVRNHGIGWGSTRNALPSPRRFGRGTGIGVGQCAGLCLFTVWLARSTC